MKRNKPFNRVSKKQDARLRELRRVKLMVAERSGGRCERMILRGWSYGCCDKLATDFHHKLLRSQGGQHTTDNVIHLCFWCHRWAHSNPKAAMAEGLVLKRSLK